MAPPIEGATVRPAATPATEPDFAGPVVRHEPAPEPVTEGRITLDLGLVQRGVGRTYSLFSNPTSLLSVLTGPEPEEPIQVDVAHGSEFRIQKVNGRGQEVDVARIGRLHGYGKAQGTFLTVLEGQIRVRSGGTVEIVTAGRDYLLQSGDVVERMDGGEPIHIMDSRLDRRITLPPEPSAPVAPAKGGVNMAGGREIWVTDRTGVRQLKGQLFEGSDGRTIYVGAYDVAVRTHFQQRGAQPDSFIIPEAQSDLPYVSDDHLISELERFSNEAEGYRPRAFFFASDDHLQRFYDKACRFFGADLDGSNGLHNQLGLYQVIGSDGIPLKDGGRLHFSAKGGAEVIMANGNVFQIDESARTAPKLIVPAGQVASGMIDQPGQMPSQVDPSEPKVIVESAADMSPVPTERRLTRAEPSRLTRFFEGKSAVALMAAAMFVHDIAEHYHWGTPDQRLGVSAGAFAGFVAHNPAMLIEMALMGPGMQPGRDVFEALASIIGKATGIADLQEGGLSHMLLGSTGAAAGGAVSLKMADMAWEFLRQRGTVGGSLVDAIRSTPIVQYATAAGAAGTSLLSGAWAYVAPTLTAAGEGLAGLGASALLIAGAAGGALGYAIHKSGVGRVIGTEQAGESLGDTIYNWTHSEKLPRVTKRGM